MSTQVGFNYEILKDTKFRNEAKKQAQEINKLLKSSTEAIVEIGRRLIAMRESMQSAMFRAWIECEFRWQQSTAANYMQTARQFGELDCLQNFQPTALIMLARSNVPEKLANTMIARAKAGDIVTQKVVKQALAADPNFVPTRKDAGVPRKLQSAPSISQKEAAPASLVEIVASGPLTIDSLQRSLDAFSASLPLLELQQTDRDALANRFFELAVQLRTLPARTVPKDEPKAPKTRAAKPRSRKTAA